MSRRRRWCFVVPRYGTAVAGGAETLVRELAEHLVKRGDYVRVMTTCAVDNRTWENAMPQGESEESGVVVQRFPVDSRNLERWVPLQIRISEGMRLTIEEQLEWLSQGVNSTALYAKLATEAPQFDALFFAPYLFGTTFFGSLVCPERAVLIPCLHDEQYAYVDAISSMFRQVRGCLFNAAPEMDLARGLYGKLAGGEVGMGFEPFSEDYVASLEPFFQNQSPYLVYVGRKETGKNAHLLVDHFIEAKAQNRLPVDLKLVVVGGGSFSDLHRPAALERADIVDVTHVSERDKHRIIRHAALLCQPSTNESFSIVLMEAWLLHTPVLVHAGCPVTRSHAIESGGGLYFGDAVEFAATVRAMVEDRVLRTALAESGYRYVRSKYDWTSVLERFDQIVGGIFKENQEQGGEAASFRA